MSIKFHTNNLANWQKFTKSQNYSNQQLIVITADIGFEKLNVVSWIA